MADSSQMANVVVQRLSGVAPGTATTVMQVRFRLDDLDNLDMLSPVTAANEVSCIARQDITSSVTAQSVEVSSSAFFAANDYAILDAGVNQEVVRLTAVANVSHVTAIFRKAHSKGVKIRKVLGTVSKTFRLNVTKAPNSAIARIKFWRVSNPMPENVFDQYRIVSVYAQGASTPWISSAVDKFSAVPSTLPTSILLAGGPFTAIGVPTGSMIEIQWLVTFGAEDCMAEYKYQWDES